jgi:hypothetical protein
MSNKTRTKILIVISNSFHMRSVLDSGLVAGMADSFEIVLAIEKNLLPELPIIEERIFPFSTSRFNQKVTNLLMDSGTWKYRNRSSSFRYRIKRRLVGDISFKELNGRSKVKYPFRYAKNLGKYLMLGNILSNSALRLLSQTIQEREYQIGNLLSETKPDIVLIWSQTLDPASSAFIYLSRAIGFPHVLIADNWDNLFSKTVFPIKPDLVGCFGEQSAEFGSQLHGIPENRFVALGSARFDVYRNLPKVNSRSLIIFAGSSMPEDDVNILTLMDQVRVDTFSRISSQHLSWRYRPHPVPQHSVSSLVNSYPNIEFTNQPIQIGKRRWPDLTDSVVELANTRVAICMPTSYLLEALVCEVPVIIPVFKEMVGLTSSKSLMDSLAHLKDIEKLPGVFIANSPSEFIDQLSKLLEEDLRITPTKHLDYFVNWSQGSFLENLTSMIEDLTRMKPGPQG